MNDNFSTQSPASMIRVLFNGVLIAALIFALWPLLRWMILDADFLGDDRSACDSGGACWVFVQVRFGQFMFGLYESSERWRPLLLLGLWLLASVPLWWPKIRGRYILVPLVFTLMPFISWGVLDGRWLGLPQVESSRWGGLMLTLLISSIGISLSLPLGIVLALGRQSKLPVIKWFCVAFIELWRGVPLITVLFMASVMLPIFLPPGVEFDKLVRVLIGVTLFTSAYMAEVVRAGLLAVPKGQFEASAALGLNVWQRLLLVILPQALQRMIPSIVNTFISLFKDTSLVLIVGMFDLLGMVQTAATDPHWLGYAVEGYIFAGFLFWIIAFSMSRFSLRLEQRFKLAKQRN